MEKRLTGLKNTFTKVGAAVSAVFALRTVVQFGREASQTASELSNALTGLESILEGQGRSFADAQAFLEEYTNDGLIPATNAITAYKNLASRGYDDSQIRQVMVALKDASAFGRAAGMSMGKAVESAAEGLRQENSVLVDNAGVTKNVAKMWEEYAEQIGTTANNLTKQQKIQAEVLGILEESKYQTGDAAKVAETFSGQVQRLSFCFNDLNVAFGNFINPIAQQFLPVINRMITGLTRVVNIGAQAVAVLFGKTVQVSQQTEAVEESVRAEEKLADATEAATAAMKRQHAGFDEMNVLSSGSLGGSNRAAAGSATAAGNPAIVVSSGTRETVQDLTVVEDAIMQIRQSLERLKNYVAFRFAPTFSAWKAAFAELAGPAVEAFRKVQNSLQRLWEQTLVPMGKYLLGEWIPGITNEISKTLAPTFSDVLGFAIGQVGTDFEQLCTDLDRLIREIWMPGMNLAKDVALDAMKAVCEAWFRDGDELLKNLAAVKDGIRETWNSIYSAVLKPIIEKIAETVGWLWERHLKKLWENLTALFFSVANHISALWTGYLKPMVDSVVQYVWPQLKNVVWFLIDLAGSAFATVSDVVDGLLMILRGLLDFLTGIFTQDAKKAFGGLEEIAKGAMNSINGLIRGSLNVLIDLLNLLWKRLYSAIEGIVNGLGSTIAGIGKIFGQEWGFSVPKNPPLIPKLAQGAVIPANREFLAVLGDQKNGRNLEAPEELIRQIVREESGENIGPITVILKVGSHRLGKVVLASLNELTRQNGDLVLALE